VIIALLDDGIDVRQCPGFSIKYDLIVEKEGTIRPRRAGEAVVTHHGTTCAQIIHNYAPEAEFCSLGIFCKPELTTGLSQLLAALKWCLKMRIPLIHMSVGSTQICDDAPLRKIVAQILRQGQIIVAAHSNRRSRYTMPACYSGVLGVSADEDLTGPQFYVKDPLPDDVRIFASAKHDLSQYPGNSSSVTAPVSNSYAAPTITAEVHNILTRFNGQAISIPALIRRLAGRTVSALSMCPDFLEDVIVYDPAQAFENAYADFQTLGSFSDDESFLAALEHDPNSPALLVPPVHLNRQFIASLFQRSKTRTGIAYAGIVPADLLQETPCLLWSENTYHSFAAQLYKRPIPREIPVMQIASHKKTALSLLCQLKKRFSMDGYGCVTISDFPKVYLYGTGFVTKGCPADILAAHLCYTRHPDLILAAIGDESSENLPCDMKIAFKDCAEAEIGEDMAILPLEPTGEDIENLYSSLFDG